MAVIDWTKPIELSDGTPAEVKSEEDRYGIRNIHFKDAEYTGASTTRQFHADGTQRYLDWEVPSLIPVRGRTIRNVIEKTDQELADKYRELVEERLKLRNELFERGYSMYYDGKKVGSVGDVAKYDFRKSIEVKI